VLGYDSVLALVFSRPGLRWKAAVIGRFRGGENALADGLQDAFGPSQLKLADCGRRAARLLHRADPHPRQPHQDHPEEFGADAEPGGGLAANIDCHASRRGGSPLGEHRVAKVDGSSQRAAGRKITGDADRPV
jgi:hypothetical protein